MLTQDVLEEIKSNYEHAIRKKYVILTFDIIIVD